MFIMITKSTVVIATLARKTVFNRTHNPNESCHPLVCPLVLSHNHKINLLWQHHCDDNSNNDGYGGNAISFENTTTLDGCLLGTTA
jgi:hypothetical protein